MNEVDEADMLRSMKNPSTYYCSSGRFDVCREYVKLRLELKSQVEVDERV